MSEPPLSDMKSRPQKRRGFRLAAKAVLGLSLWLTLFPVGSFAQQPYAHSRLRWIGTNLYDFSGLFGNNNFLIRGRVERFYTNGVKRVHVPAADVRVDCTEFRVDDTHKTTITEEEFQAIGSAEQLVGEGKVTLDNYSRVKPLVRQFIRPIKTNTIVLLLNCPVQLSQVGSTVSVYAWAAGPQDSRPVPKKGQRGADGSPRSFMLPQGYHFEPSIPLDDLIFGYDHGRPFSTNTDSRPAVYYRLTPAGAVKRTFPTNEVQRL